MDDFIAALRGQLKVMDGEKEDLDGLSNEGVLYRYFERISISAGSGQVAEIKSMAESALTALRMVYGDKLTERKTPKTAPAETEPTVNRARLIRLSRDAHNSMREQLICSQRAWINQKLRDAGEPVLRTEELRKFSIQVD